MKRSVTIAIVFVLLVGCTNESTNELPKDVQPAPLRMANFERELSKLSEDSIASIDQATRLFQSYAANAEGSEDIDSLFMPYFQFYNVGAELLKSESEELQLNYGFNRHFEFEDTFLLPTQSNYLDQNILKHLSAPMQKFCRQNLKEFDDFSNLETMGHNVLWWEKFIQEHPNFFLMEMAAFHYKNWHLSNFLSGTTAVRIFSEKGHLTTEAHEAYLEFVQNEPDSNTAEIIREYLIVLERNKFERTEEIVEFLSVYE